MDRRRQLHTTRRIRESLRKAGIEDPNDDDADGKMNDDGGTQTESITMQRVRRRYEPSIVRLDSDSIAQTGVLRYYGGIVRVPDQT